MFHAMHGGGQSFTVWGKESLGLPTSEYGIMVINMKEKPLGFYIPHI